MLLVFTTRATVASFINISDFNEKETVGGAETKLARIILFYHVSGSCIQM